MHNNIPYESLSIHQIQNIFWNLKLLLAYFLSKTTATVEIQAYISTKRKYVKSESKNIFLLSENAEANNKTSDDFATMPRIKGSQICRNYRVPKEIKRFLDITEGNSSFHGGVFKRQVKSKEPRKSHTSNDCGEDLRKKMVKIFYNAVG